MQHSDKGAARPGSNKARQQMDHAAVRPVSGGSARTGACRKTAPREKGCRGQMGAARHSVAPPACTQNFGGEEDPEANCPDPAL